MTKIYFRDGWDGASLERLTWIMLYSETPLSWTISVPDNHG